MDSSLKTSKPKKRIILLYALALLPIVSGLILFNLISNGILGYIPSFEELENPKNMLATEVLSSDNKLLGVYFKENRSTVEYSEISPNLVNALLATEDARFYEHSGIDGIAILRALMGAATFNPKGGGSTISQQLAKLLYHDPDKNVFHRILQKLNEWVIAVRIEKRYTKEEIIALYFNKFDFLLHLLNFLISIHNY